MIRMLPLLLTSLVLASVAAATEVDRRGWHYRKGREYIVSAWPQKDGRSGWDFVRASEECRKLGGDIASIPTEELFVWLKATLLPKPGRGDTLQCNSEGAFWVGLTKPYKCGGCLQGLRWRDGNNYSVWADMNWLNSNSSAEVDTFNHVIMDSCWDYRWDVQSNDEKARFLCQRDARWERYNDKEYLVSTWLDTPPPHDWQLVTYQDAADSCYQRGGQLASIPDAEVLVHLKLMFLPTPTTECRQSGKFWIGLVHTDDPCKTCLDTWRWLDGSKYNTWALENWREKAESFMGQAQAGYIKDCLDYTWGSQHVEARARYICQRAVSTNAVSPTRFEMKVEEGEGAGNDSLVPEQRRPDDVELSEPQGPPSSGPAVYIIVVAVVVPIVCVALLVAAVLVSRRLKQKRKEAEERRRKVQNELAGESTA